MPAKTESISAPYAYPWRENKSAPSQVFLGLAGVAFLAIGAFLSVPNFRDGELLQGTVGLIFFAMFGVASLGAAIRVAKPRGGIQFLNSVVLTEAQTPPTDSWVHLIRFRRANVGAVIIIFAFGLGLLALTAVGVHHVITTSVDSAGYFRLVPAAILGGLGILITIVGVRTLLMSSRTTSVGERPVGVAIGESGLMLHMLGLDAELPWASVESVEAGTITVGRGRRGEQEIPTIDIRALGKLHCLPIASLATPPLLAYSALKLYLDNPGLRGELGTTVAQKRFEEWQKALVGR